MKQAAALLLAFCLVISFTACAAIPEDSIVKLTAGEDSGSYYFYGVEKGKEGYYACVLSEYREEPGKADMLYAPLADELVASFQPPGSVGAWCPEQYFTAKELEAAAEDGRITAGAYFAYSVTDGCIDYLSEYDYYQGFDVTTGMPVDDYGTPVSDSEAS